MKIKQSRSKLAILVTIITASLIILGGIAYLYSQKPTTQTYTPNPVNYSPPSKSEKQENQDRKAEIINEQEQDNKDVTDLSKVAITISRVGRVGDVVSLRSVVNGASTGTCNVLFTQGDIHTEKQFPIILQSTYYACNTDVAASEFKSGTWKATVWLSDSKGAKSESTSADFNL